jgi:hypothetical protein
MPIDPNTKLSKDQCAILSSCGVFDMGSHCNKARYSFFCIIALKIHGESREVDWGAREFLGI